MRTERINMADLIIPKVWEGKEICICVTEERAVFVYDKEQDKFIDTGETAIELPPHGRLIDADKLKWFALAPTILEASEGTGPITGFVGDGTEAIEITGFVGDGTEASK